MIAVIPLVAALVASILFGIEASHASTKLHSRKEDVRILRLESHRRFLTSAPVDIDGAVADNYRERF